jgi:hypothetical protein
MSNRPKKTLRDGLGRPPVDPGVKHGKKGRYKCPSCFAPLDEDWEGQHRGQCLTAVEVERIRSELAAEEEGQ